jgi:hypothetical protein
MVIRIGALIFFTWWFVIAVANFEFEFWAIIEVLLLPLIVCYFILNLYCQAEIKWNGDFISVKRFLRRKEELPISNLLSIELSSNKALGRN